MKCLLFSVLFFIFLLEAALRITGKWITASEKSTGRFFYEWGYETHRHYAYPPNDTFVMDIGEYSWEYHTNSLGYREREMDTAPPHAIRALVIGDSFAEGNGTSYDSSWARHLERRLQQKHPDAEVYVCGISGFDPFYAYVALKERLLPYRPTHVLISVNDSDFDDYIIRGGFSRFKEGNRVQYKDPPWFLPVYRYSHIARMIAHTFCHYDYYLIQRVHTEKVRREAADSISACLQNIYQLCRENHIRFLAVIYPVPHKVCYATDDHILSDVPALEKTTAAYPALFLYNDLSKNLKAGDCMSYCWKTDSHFNNKGYALLAHLIDSAIQAQHPDFWSIPDSPGY